MREFANLAEMHAVLGQEVAVSDWVEITQERINLFADATDDHQWIHIDRERCENESPFRTPIAHGFLTLSMVSSMTIDEIGGGAQLTWQVTVECEHAAKPVCVAELLLRRYP